MIEVDFKDALHQAGLSTKATIIADGVIHRVYVEGDRKGSKNGWYVLFNDSIAAGAFGSWKTGACHKWCAQGEGKLTTAQREEYAQRMREAQQAREAERKRRYQGAHIRANTIWDNAPIVPPAHLYLVRKKVKSYGLRQHNGALIIPMHNSAGVINSLQFIDGEGRKRFLSGGCKKGHYFLMEGAGEAFLIAEGYATAATLREVTGLSVAVAFDAGNLKPVAQAIRGKHPNAKITICADNDTKSEINIGVEKAKEAAQVIGAFLAIPACNGDFNDFYNGATPS